MKMGRSFIFLRLIPTILLSMAISTCSNPVIYDPAKKHHGEDQFKPVMEISIFNFFKMLFLEGSYPEIDPAERASILQNADIQQLKKAAPKPRITWIGQATVLVQFQDVNFLTDPHFSNVASPIDWLGAERITPPALKIEELPKIDFVVISHNHYDHLDHRTVDMIGNSVTWFVPLGLKKWFLERGIESKNVHELDWWDTYQWSEKVNVMFTPNIHWSKRSLWDTNKTLWGSWDIQIDDFKTWFAGDTGYDEKVFKQIGEQNGPFDLALIPIGAYAPRYFMSPQHVDPVEAVQVHLDVQSRKSVPIHWGTFQLSHEPLLEPPTLLSESVKKAGLAQDEFEAIRIGQTIELNLMPEKSL